MAANALGYTNSQGQKWTDTTKYPVGKASDGRTLYSDGSKGWTSWSPVQGPTMPQNNNSQSPQSNSQALLAKVQGMEQQGQQPQQTQNSPTFDYQGAMQKALDATRQANQPQIQSLQSSIDPLKQRYSDLISSIKGQQTVAENKQTQVTNNELGKRGILGSSGVAGQEIASAVAPVTSQFTGLVANAGMAETKDINDINSQIASLQAGNPAAAMSMAGNLQSYDMEAKKLAATIAQQQIENEMAKKKLAYDTQANVDPSKYLNNPTNQNNNKGLYIPSIGKSVVGKLPDGRTLYSDGSAGWSQY